MSSSLLYCAYAREVLLKGTFAWSQRWANVTLGSVRELDAVDHGVETYNLDAVFHGANPLGPKIKFCQAGVQICTFFKKKGQILKKLTA